MQSYRRRRQKGELRADDYAGVWMSEPTGSVPFTCGELFQKNQPIELEVGSGRGMFLLREASRRPETNFIGVEWATKFARETADRAIRLKLDNVCMFSCDAELLIRYMPTGWLNAVHVLFPDPWWKRRHRDRRFVRKDNIPNIARLIKPGGKLHLATDVAEYFEKMLAAVAACQHPASDKTADQSSDNAPAFELLEGPSIFTGLKHNDEAMTHFERKYRKEGRPIHRVVYRRTS